MPPRTRKTAGADDVKPADEAQTEVQDAEVVTDPEPTTELGKFQAAFATARKQIRSEIGGEITALQKQMDDIAALASEAGTVPGGVDYSEALDEIRGTVAALQEGRVTPVQFQELADSVSNLEGHLAELAGMGPSRESPARPGVPAVYQKVLELMRLVDEIGKEGHASYGSGEGQANYSFRGVDQAMNAVGSAMRQVGLIMETKVLDKEFSVREVPKINSRTGQQYGVTTWTTARVTMRYTFISPLDGSRHDLEGLGVGKDFGDKDGSKALAAAMKYALFQGLCIPVKGMNIDPETDSADTGNVPEPEQYRPQARPAPQQPQQPQQAQQAPPADDPWDSPPPDGTPEHMQERPAPASAGVNPQERALAALKAAKAQNNMAGLNGVLAQASKEDLLAVEVEGLPLRSHLVAISRTLAPQQGQQE